MKFYQNLASVITGTAIMSALIVTIPQKAQALTGEEINEIARNVTVLIKSENHHGSGVLLSQNGNTYYVLTAYHVVRNEDKYGIVTVDHEVHSLDYSKVKKLEGADLAIIEFTSDKPYQVAKLADSTTVQQGSSVFVSGWPRPSQVENAAGGDLVRQFTNGQVSAFLPQATEGYQMSYTNITLGGMSGGPVFDTGGRLVGIHGMGGSEEASTLVAGGIEEDSAEGLAKLIKTGFNYAIPINTFLDLAAQQRIYMSLNVENTPASPLGLAYVPSTEVDPRDQMSSGEVLTNIQQGLNIMQTIFSIF